MPGVSKEVEEGPPMVSGARLRYASSNRRMLAAARMSDTVGSSLAGLAGGLLMPSAAAMVPQQALRPRLQTRLQTDCRSCTAAPAVWPRLGPPCTRTDAAAAGTRPVLARPRLPAGPCVSSLCASFPSLCPQHSPLPSPAAVLCAALGCRPVQAAPLHSCTGRPLQAAAAEKEFPPPLWLASWPPAWPPCWPASPSPLPMRPCTSPPCYPPPRYSSHHLYLFTQGPAQWPQLRGSWSWNDGEAPDSPAYHAPHYSPGPNHGTAVN